MRTALLIIASALLLSACTNQQKNTTQSIADYCDSIHADDSLKLSGALAPLDSFIQNKTAVHVLEDGGGSLIARAWLCEHAEKSIDIQYFIFSTDNVGLIACDYLVRAADRGVKVRIIVDDLLVDASAHEILVMDSHENIDIRIYNPGANLGQSITGKIRKLVTDFHGFNQRMHNKTFIVDGKVVITGGRNLADEYYDYDHTYNFRDRDVLLIGRAAPQVSSSFESYWSDPLCVAASSLFKFDPGDYRDSNRFEALHQYACNPENFWPQIRDRIRRLPEAFKELQESGQLQWVDSVSFIADPPGKNPDRPIAKGSVTTDSLIALVKRAKTSIDIQSPYLVTTELSRNLFREAVKRGVKVRILTNSLSSTDNVEAFSGYQRDRQAILATGVRIFEFRPDAAERRKIMTGDLQKKLDFTPIFGMHAKSMVIDGRITVIGTFNLDPRSANLNTECITVIHSDSVAAGVLRGMEIEFLPGNSWETTATFNPDSVAGWKKQVKALSRRIVPKSIL